jgi:tetratricopeptide (TPR) repeat protein
MSKKIRRLALALTITGSSMLSTGCMSPSGFSLSSANPFAKETPGQAAGTSPLKSVATSTKNAWGKSRDAVTGIFKGQTAQEKAVAKREAESDVDPLRLDRKTDVGPEVFVANGRLWESTGNRQKAMESYTKALEVKPNDAKALASIARLHHGGGDHAKAIEFFQKAIQQDPEESTLHNDLGLTYSKSGNNQAAVASLTTALKMDPGTSRYANNLATVKFDQGKSDEALSVLMENNKPAVAHYNMAYLFQERGQVDDAKKHLSEAVKYKNEGRVDSSIARAVNRSQEMLAKLEGPKSGPNSAPGMVPGVVPGVAPSAVPGGLPANTAIAKSQAPAASETIPQLPTPTRTSVTIRQTSQAMDKNSRIAVKPAGGKGSSTSNKRVQANFATARLGSKTEPVAKTPSVGPAAKPATAGAFTLPPGFGAGL